MHADGVVLVVDDEPRVRDLIIRHLQLAGVRGEPVACPEDLPERIDRGDVALVILDINLGSDTSGVELRQQLRSSHPDLPVVFVTGYSHLAEDHPDVPLVEKDAAETAEATALTLAKPLDFRKLVLVVKGEIRNRCRDQQLEDTHKVAQGTHTIVCDLRDALVHPETGLKAALTVAKAAYDRDPGDWLIAYFKRPIVKALLGIIVFLGGVITTVVSAQYAEWNELHKALIKQKVIRE